MRLLGRKVSLFGGGMGRVEFVKPLVAGKDVLDIGVVQHTPSAASSSNWLHRHVRAVAKSCVGIDTVAEGITNLCSQGYDVRLADASRFDLGQQFDVVLAGDIIEHLHDLRGFFESVKRHLRRGGTLILLTANPWFGARFAQALMGRGVYENPEHTAWYTPGTLGELLRRYDFEITHVQYGSSEQFLQKMSLLPKELVHTSVWAVVRRS